MSTKGREYTKNIQCHMSHQLLSMSVHVTNTVHFENYCACYFIFGYRAQYASYKLVFSIVGNLETLACWCFTTNVFIVTTVCIMGSLHVLEWEPSIVSC